MSTVTTEIKLVRAFEKRAEEEENSPDYTLHSQELNAKEESLRSMRIVLSDKRKEYVRYRTYSIDLNTIYNNYIDGLYEGTEFTDAIERMDTGASGAMEASLYKVSKGVSMHAYMQDFYKSAAADFDRLQRVWCTFANSEEKAAFIKLVQRLGLARHTRDTIRSSVMNLLEEIEENRLTIHEELEFQSKRSRAIVENEKIIDASKGLPSRPMLRTYYYLLAQYARLEHMGVCDSGIEKPLKNALLFIEHICEGTVTDVSKTQFKTDVLAVATIFYDQFKETTIATDIDLQFLFTKDGIVDKFITTVNYGINDTYIKPALDILKSVNDDDDILDRSVWKNVQYLAPRNVPNPFMSDTFTCYTLYDHKEAVAEFYTKISAEIKRIILKAKKNSGEQSNISVQDLIGKLPKSGKSYPKNAKPFEILKSLVDSSTMLMTTVSDTCVICHFYGILEGIGFKDDSLSTLHTELTRDIGNPELQRELAKAILKSFNTKFIYRKNDSQTELNKKVNNAFDVTFTKQINAILTLAGGDVISSAEAPWECLSYIVEALQTLEKHKGFINKYEITADFYPKSLQERLRDLRNFHTELHKLVKKKIAEGNEIWKNSGLLGISYNYKQLNIEPLVVNLKTLQRKNYFCGRQFECLIKLINILTVPPTSSFWPFGRTVPVEDPKPVKINLLF